jgi:hypothetical protein
MTQKQKSKAAPAKQAKGPTKVAPLVDEAAPAVEAQVGEIDALLAQGLAQARKQKQAVRYICACGSIDCLVGNVREVQPGDARYDDAEADLSEFKHKTINGPQADDD